MIVRIPEDAAAAITCRYCGAPLERIDETTWEARCEHGARIDITERRGTNLRVDCSRPDTAE